MIVVVVMDKGEEKYNNRSAAMKCLLETLQALKCGVNKGLYAFWRARLNKPKQKKIRQRAKG